MILKKVKKIKEFFNETRRFWIIESVIFIVFLSITLLEITRFGRYEELFTKTQFYISWFFGLTFGVVFGNVKSKVKKKLDETVVPKLKFRTEPDSSFAFFLCKLIVIVFFSVVIIGIMKYYIIKLFIFTPLLMFQWLILLYIWYKLENKTKPVLKYILMNEAILVINLIILLLAFII
jgi:hypothetical protein